MKNPKNTQSKSINSGFSLNENGSVLLTTVIILLLLTVIGVRGINTASTDLKITRNYRVYKENLMLADAAVNRAAKDVMNALADNIIGRAWVADLDGVTLIEDLQDADAKYIKDSTSYNPYINSVTNRINVDAVIEDWGTIPEITPEALDSQPDTEYVAFLQMEMGAEPNDREATAVVISRSRKNGGNVILEAGIGRDDS